MLPKVLWSCCLLIGASWGLAGQSTTASMLGMVRDASGAGVPNAEVFAVDVQTSLERTTRADPTGAYLLTNLPIGLYSLTVTASGFNKFVQTGITLNVN